MFGSFYGNPILTTSTCTFTLDVKHTANVLFCIKTFTANLQSSVQTRVVMISGFQTQYPRTHLRLQTLFDTTGIFIPVTNIIGGVTFQQIKQKATVWTDCSRSSVLEARQYRFILMRKLHKCLFYESFTDKYQRILHTWSRKSKHKYKNEPTEICFMTFTQDFQLSLTTGSTFNKLPLLAFHSCALFYGLWRHH